MPCIPYVNHREGNPYQSNSLSLIERHSIEEVACALLQSGSIPGIFLTCCLKAGYLLSGFLYICTCYCMDKICCYYIFLSIRRLKIRQMPLYFFSYDFLPFIQVKEDIAQLRHCLHPSLSFVFTIISQIHSKMLHI